MAMPLLALEFNPDARTFSFGDSAAEGFDERLDVGKRNGSRGRAREDGCERFALLGIHAAMIAKSAITCNASGLRRLTFDMSGMRRQAKLAGVTCPLPPYQT